MSSKELSKKERKRLNKKQGKISGSKKGGRGTHGALNKAGKVRGQTNKTPKTSTKRRSGPLKQNRIEYIKRMRIEKEVENKDAKYRDTW